MHFWTDEGWKTIDSAPEGIVIDTKIDDGKTAIRNHQLLRRRGRLWFNIDGKTYVYYTPTHWRERPR